MPFFTTELDDVKSSATGGADPWPSDVYLNVGVCNDLRDGIGRVILGYAQFPGGPPTTDGVVIANFCFGKGGTAQTPFHLGRTATHEIGHWLDLRHIWGDDRGSCSGSDMVEDTPNQADATFNSPTFPQISCSNGPNGNMFMNCMDYTDDVAMFMFTKGQSRRMDACLEGARALPGRTGLRADGRPNRACSRTNHGGPRGNAVSAPFHTGTGCPGPRGCFAYVPRGRGVAPFPARSRTAPPRQPQRDVDAEWHPGRAQQ
ncbi:UNVERIFIED_ORG: hypothetical protein ABIB19_003811 [Arthrobacter sp. UYEF10]